MAGNINIPKDVEKVLNIKITDNSAPLRRLLVEILTSHKALEERVKKLENANSSS